MCAPAAPSIFISGTRAGVTYTLGQPLGHPVLHPGGQQQQEQQQGLGTNVSACSHTHTRRRTLTHARSRGLVLCVHALGTSKPPCTNTAHGAGHGGRRRAALLLAAAARARLDTARDWQRISLLPWGHALGRPHPGWADSKPGWVCMCGLMYAWLMHACRCKHTRTRTQSTQRSCMRNTKRTCSDTRAHTHTRMHARTHARTQPCTHAHMYAMHA